MLNFKKKLSLVVLSGALTLGLSPVVVAKSDFRATNWLAALDRLDCPMTCKEVEMYVIMGGVDHKDRKPISICTTKVLKSRKGKIRYHRDGEWLVGYNRWKENTCNVAIDGQEYRGERYFCLCTTHGIQPLR